MFITKLTNPFALHPLHVELINSPIEYKHVSLDYWLPVMSYALFQGLFRISGGGRVGWLDDTQMTNLKSVVYMVVHLKNKKETLENPQEMRSQGIPVTNLLLSCKFIFITCFAKIELDLLKYFIFSASKILNFVSKRYCRDTEGDETSPCEQLFLVLQEQISSKSHHHGTPVTFPPFREPQLVPLQQGLDFNPQARVEGRETLSWTL